MAVKIFFVILPIIIKILQVHPSSLQKSLVVPYAGLLQENLASTQLEQQINSSITSVIGNIASYDAYVRNITEQVLEEYHNNIRQKISSLSSNITGLQSSRTRSLSGATNIAVSCLLREGKLDLLADKVNNQVKKCATVAMAEMVNVISDSLEEAQTFMSIPRVIGKDIQRCGLSYNCRWDIVGDAISEAIQVPPKVYALTAKIQSIALRTIVSVDNCGLQGLREIIQTAVGILENVFLCMGNSTTSY